MRRRSCHINDLTTVSHSAILGGATIHVGLIKYRIIEHGIYLGVQMQESMGRCLRVTHLKTIKSHTFKHLEPEVMS